MGWSKDYRTGFSGDWMSGTVRFRCVNDLCLPEAVILWDAAEPNQVSSEILINTVVLQYKSTLFFFVLSFLYHAVAKLAYLYLSITFLLLNVIIFFLVGNL